MGDPNRSCETFVTGRCKHRSDRTEIIQVKFLDEPWLLAEVDNLGLEVQIVRLYGADM